MIPRGKLPQRRRTQARRMRRTKLSNVPSELKGASIKKMSAFVKKLSDSELLRVLEIYESLAKKGIDVPKANPDLENMAQCAGAEKWMRQMSGKWKLKPKP